MNRSSLKKTEFLDVAGWGRARTTLLAGDASTRSYDRLADARGRTAILMNAQNESTESFRAFAEIAGHLAEIGLSAPEIYEIDEDAGLMLLEDLGDDLFARVLLGDASKEPELYFAAIDVLLALRTARLPKCPLYDADQMAKLAATSFSWYAGQSETDFVPDLVSHFSHLNSAQCLTLRDYHSENLIWLPSRTGLQKVGLLDFQDAAISHPAYDLVSVLEDARRDLGDGIHATGLDYYIHKSGTEPDEFRYAFALAGAQRNLRILGVFSRLSLKFGKQRYVDLIPRVWTHLMNDLAHPELDEMRHMVLDSLPPPTESHLSYLKQYE